MFNWREKETHKNLKNIVPIRVLEVWSELNNLCLMNNWKLKKINKFDVSES